MKIILDITRLVRNIAKKKTLTGIDRVSMAYVSYYETRAQALIRWNGVNLILSSSQSKKLFSWIKKPDSKYSLIFIVIKGITFKRKSAEALLLNTGHIGLNQKNYISMINRYHLKPVFFIHDLIPITYPEYCSANEDVRHRIKINYALKLGHGIITNSTATRIDLEYYAKETNQKLPPITSALLASNMNTISPGKRPIDKPYFVILSTIDPRKNHALLLQIWRSLVQNIGEKTPHLVIIGKRGWECEQVLDLLERCHFLQGFVTEISKCNDQDLANYIHYSQALLFPSFIEGYGLPLIEALSLKIPVIASDLPVFKEIAGDVPEYINPLDGKKWTEIIMDYANPDSNLRKSQIIRIKKFQEPTWENHFVEIDSFLKKIGDF